MSDASPHPVSESQAYQQHLLRLLGSDDPAAVQAGTPEELRALVDGVPADLLKHKPDDHEYSVLEVLGHMADAELVMATRYRWVVAEDSPELMEYDQDLWVAGLRHQQGDPGSFLKLFAELRHANLELWHSSTSERGRAGQHRERGEESFELMFRLIAGHDRLHVEQARDTLEAARKALRSA
jgi:hypothetical protein